MSDADKQLARFLVILLNGAREAIQSAESDEAFEDLDAKLDLMIKKLKEDSGDAC